MKDFSREERLGKKLLKLYGLEAIELPYAGISVSLKKSFPYRADNWRVLLLGECGYHCSLNQLIKFIEEPVPFIEYSSLEELDIQLTLMGMNG